MRKILSKKIDKLITITIIMVLGIFLCFPNNTFAATDGYPRLANYYIAWDVKTDIDIENLSKWDLVILSPQSMERNPQLISKLRQKNSKIKILVYMPIQEITYDPALLKETPYWTEVYNTVNQNNWWLKKSDGQHASFWPGNWFINASSVAPKTNGQNWADYLPELMYKKYLSTDTWDGIFYDNVWHGLSWLKQPIDINGDGPADSDQAVDEAWRSGLSQIIIKTRNLAPTKMIFANANTNYYNNILNGRMHENFPTQSEGGWSGSMSNYLSANFAYAPKGFILNANTNNTGEKNNYQIFRYNMTSALMGDGYFSFDYGDLGHDRLWWYDEYDYYLGQAKTEAKNLLDAKSKEIKAGVWQRDFENALAIVNSTSTNQKISFEAEYEKIKGIQDKTTNNGAVIKNITLSANDGLILLRRIEEITNTAFFNGSFIRVFDNKGLSQRNGFFLYENEFRGGNVISKEDINKDNKYEIIVADASKITIYDENKNVLNTFYPYGTKYNKGINYDLADLDGDGNKEIITGTLRGYAPLVKIFDNKGKVINPGFYAYAKSFTGGVNVSVCDFKGNGEKSIVTGAGYMGGSSVKIFNKNGKLLGAAYAYAKTFKGGVYVTCGDINGDNKDEIITGAGYSGTPQVRIFNNKFQEVGKSFWAYEQTSKNGVRVFANDIDGDGIDEILAATPSTFTTSITK
ncbi:VCBS repeat-containing protein [Candidatus Falkowbacteria bacterium]|nr:VCBS repeat-containing protein [Candidatus Falkowbacteria bacterium]